MPDIFEDTVGTWDLTITTSADWTVSSGGLPNGDNYVTGDGSIAATYNTDGDAFDFSDGTAWSVEFWMYYASATAVAQQIVGVYDNGTTTAAWRVYFESDESLRFYIENTGSGAYLDTQSSALASGTWYYVVGIKETGNTLRLYIDTVQAASDTTTSGTARTPGGTYYVYFGTAGDGSLDMGASSSGLRISKLAIYNKQLSTSEINDHYLAMTAS